MTIDELIALLQAIPEEERKKELWFIEVSGYHKELALCDDEMGVCITGD